MHSQMIEYTRKFTYEETAINGPVHQCMLEIIPHVVKNDFRVEKANMITHEMAN